MIYSPYDEIKPVKDFICGKSIAIVGNAKSIFDGKYGKDIDAHDVVIRFNKGFITAPDAQGSKTDILLLACELTAEELQGYNAKYVINRSSKTKCGEYTITDGRRRVLKELIGAYPSTGLMAIVICLCSKVKSIDLYGFDFGKTQTFYNPKGYKTKHDYAKEEAIIKDWQDKGILTIHENH